MALTKYWRASLVFTKKNHKLLCRILSFVCRWYSTRWKWCRLSNWHQEMASYVFSNERFGDVQYVIEIQIVQNSKNRTLAMSQASYIDKMLSRYKMQNFKKSLLSYIYGIHLSKEQCAKAPQEIEDVNCGI